MVKRIYILHILLTLLMVRSVSGQLTFQRTLTNGSTAARAVIQTNDGGYIFTGEGLNVTKTDQNGDIVWSNDYAGTIGRSILQLSGGDYIVVGETQSDVYVMRLDANGLVVWGKSIGGTDSDYGWSVQAAQDDGFIVCGYTKSFGEGGADIYLLRINDNGTLLWSKTYGGWADDHGRTVLATSDGGFLIGGDTFSYGVGSSDTYVLKTDANGVLEWARTYGGLTYELGYSLANTSDGNYVLCGYTNSFGAGGNDGYLIKISSSGNLLWSKTYGGPDNDYFWSVKGTSDDGFIIGGYANSFGPGNNDAYLVKVDELGVLEWAKNYDGGLNDYGQEVAITSGGDYLICGWSDSYSPALQDEVFLMRTDQFGSSGCNENDADVISGIGGNVGNGGVEGVAISTVTDLSSSAALTMGIRSVCDSLLTELETLERDKVEVKVYPNPFTTSTSFAIDGIDLGSLTFELFNIVGQSIKFESNIGDKFTLKRGSLSHGIYTYKISTKSQLIGMGKLVVN